MIFSSYSMCGDWGLRKAETNISWTSIMNQGLQTYFSISPYYNHCARLQSETLSFNVVVTCLRPYGQESVHSAVITKRSKATLYLHDLSDRGVSCSLVGSVVVR